MFAAANVAVAARAAFVVAVFAAEPAAFVATQCAARLVF